MGKKIKSKNEKGFGYVLDINSMWYSKLSKNYT